MGWQLQCVWPIVDDTFTLTELVASAQWQLDGLAKQGHCRITGPATWTTRSGCDLPGWGAYPLVLVAEMSAAPCTAATLGAAA